MSIRISSRNSLLRSGEELFNLKNTIIGYAEPSEEEQQRRAKLKKECEKKNMTPIFVDTPILKSCDVDSGVAYISAYEQFYSGHDDSEIVIELHDSDGRELWEWCFDDVVGSGAQIEANSLIEYLEKKFACPVNRSLWY